MKETELTVPLALWFRPHVRVQTVNHGIHGDLKTNIASLDTITNPII